MVEGKKSERKRRFKLGRWILLIIAGIVICALALVFGLRVEGYAHGYGNVTAHQDPLLRASQKGPVAEILAKNDQQVTEGQVLIRLDDSLARVTLLRAQKAAAEAAKEIEVFKAQCKLAQAQRQYQREQAQLQIKSARHLLDQLLAGQAKGTVSAIEVAEAQLAYDLVALQPEQTYKAQEELETQELALRQQQLSAARAEVELCQEQLVSLQVRSPIDGRVFLNPLVVGEVVDANKVLGRVFDESSFTIEAKFPERLLYRLKEGQEADVWPIGRSRWDSPLSGKVTKVGRLVQPQDTGDGYFWVTINLQPHPPGSEAGDLPLHPGQNAQITVRVGKVILFRRILGL